MSILQYLQESLVNEKVYGYKATCYHRTNSLANVYNISKEFNISGDGGGWLYGPGIYATYDLMSQLHNSMVKDYGEYILKGVISLEGFMIFEKDEAIQVYGENYHLLDQAKIIIPDHILKKNKNFIAHLQSYNFEDEYSSKFAHKIWKVLEGNIQLFTYIHGLMFNGETDGKVVVIYHQENFRPVSYSECGIDCSSPSFIKIDSDRRTTKTKKYTKDIYDTYGDNPIANIKNGVQLDRAMNNGVNILLSDVMDTADSDMISTAIKHGVKPDGKTTLNDLVYYISNPKILEIAIKNGFKGGNGIYSHYLENSNYDNMYVLAKYNFKPTKDEMFEAFDVTFHVPPNVIKSMINAGGEYSNGDKESYLDAYPENEFIFN